ncbi:MAG: hypothetical protein WBO35_01230 [Candidatus Saccharimonadales bacterium]|jgi:Tfp pilus assembly protein PilN
MINLLPPEYKQNLKYARRNRHLMHWAIKLSLAIVGALLLVGIGYLYMDRVSRDYTKQVNETKLQLEAQQYTKVQAEVKDISNNLQLVFKVLSNQVVFSELIKQLGSLMPKDTILTGLAISQTQGAIDISAQAKDYTSATQVNINLNDKDNQIFSKADIISISCTDKADSGYPCKVTIRALFVKDNPYMFLHKTSGKSGVKP